MLGKFDEKDVINRWNRFADTYAKNHGENGDPHKEVLLNPALFSLIGDVRDKNVLDAGCGEGYLSRIFCNNGANITAVDYSTRMLEIAKKRTPNEMLIDYQWGNCENLHFLEDQSFDLIVSNMVIHDLPNFEKALQEMFRLLVKGGEFVFSILHPCFAPPESGWEKTADGEKLYRKVDKYFFEGAYERVFRKAEQMVFFHRTLTTYINTLLTIGFRLEKIIEPKPDKEMLKKYPLFIEDFRCADFIVFKLTK